MSDILVTGATGHVGSAALQELRRRGIDAIGATRGGNSRAPAPPVRTLDFTDPNTWAQALDGVTRLLLVRPPAIADVGATLNAFVASAGARLEHIVFLSVAGAARIPVVPHARVERYLRDSVPGWTMLRAGFFAQNLCDAYRRDVRDDDRLFVPAGDAGVSWVDTRDVGEAAARALLDPSSRGAVWTLTGPRADSFADVAGLLSGALDRTVTYEPASIPGYLRHLTGRRGMAWPQALVQTGLHVALRFGVEERVDRTLEQVLGRPPRSVADTIDDHRHLWLR